MASYFWVILLPEAVEAAVLAIKQELHQRYGLGRAMLAPGHISMPAEVTADPDQALRLKKLTQQHAAETQPIPLVLDGFGAFPYNRVVFIKVTPQEAFQAFWLPLRARLKGDFPFPAKDLGKTKVDPHVTVAFRDVNQDIFTRVWGEFGSREFHMPFMATSIHLMTRDDRRRWVPVAEYPFAGKAVSQGELF